MKKKSSVSIELSHVIHLTITQEPKAHCDQPRQTVQNKPFVSSFSHALPGTNSYMSVTRYFNQPAPAVPTHVAAQVPSTLSLNDPVNQSSGDQSGDNFHPFDPRLEFSFRVIYSTGS